MSALTTTNPTTTTPAPQLSDKQHAELLTHFLRHELSFCGLAASADLSPADVARWISSQRTLTDLADIQRGLALRANFHDLASRISAQQLLTSLCHTRGRPDHLDPSDNISPSDNKALDRATKAATALLRHAPRSSPSGGGMSAGSAADAVGAAGHPADAILFNHLRNLAHTPHPAALNLPAHATPALPASESPPISSISQQQSKLELIPSHPSPAAQLHARAGSVPLPEGGARSGRDLPSHAQSSCTAHTTPTLPPTPELPLSNFKFGISDLSAPQPLTRSPLSYPPPPPSPP